MFGLIDHVGVATDDLDAALATYEGTFSMPVVHRETIAEQGVEAVLLDVGPCHVELLRPLGPETPVGRFMTRNGGPGLHHVAYRVDDIDATLTELADLRKAVEDGKGWYDVKISEGSVALNLATVVFIRVADGDHSIGFAG